MRQHGGATEQPIAAGSNQVSAHPGSMGGAPQAVHGSGQVDVVEEGLQVPIHAENALPAHDLAQQPIHQVA